MGSLPFFIVSGLCLGSLIALVALGYSLVYGIIKLINFAHGEFFMAGAYAGVGVYFLLPATLNPWIHLIAVLVVSGAAGALTAGLTDWVAYRPIRRSGRLSALLTAIGVSFLLQQAFSFVKNAQPISYPLTEGSLAALCRTPVKIGNDGIPILQILYIPAALLLTAGLWYVVQRTRFGKAMRAVSQDPDAAALMGINTTRVIRNTFILGGFLAGIGGTLLALHLDVNPTMGFVPGLKAFVAAVLGGIGSIPGAVLGGFLIGLTDQLLIWAGCPTQFKDISIFALLIVVLLIRPQGILGRLEREKV